MPSGEIPAVRDVDNGRLSILGAEELTHHDHLLELGARFFGEDGLLPPLAYEDSLWILGKPIGEPQREYPAFPDRLPTSRFFRTSGFAIMRQGPLALLAVGCSKGMSGYCGHTHNDFLSFELEAFGRSFLIDPGSYVYSQNPEWRNRMRGTASHNTVMINGCEQNAFPLNDLFEIESFSSSKSLRN